MNDLKVSIGLPIYNGELYLKRCLNSILGQTFINYELIISDNCSWDNSEKIIKNDFLADNRITYYKLPSNMGSAYNFRYVLSKSRYDYFIWMAVDDIWEPNHLQNLVNEILKNPCLDIIIPSTKLIDESSNVLTVFSFEKYNKKIYSKFYLSFLTTIGFKFHYLYYGLFKKSFLNKAISNAPVSKSFDRVFAILVLLCGNSAFTVEPTSIRQTFKSPAHIRYKDSDLMLSKVYKNFLGDFNTIGIMPNYLFRNPNVKFLDFFLIPFLILSYTIWIIYILIIRFISSVSQFFKNYDKF